MSATNTTIHIPEYTDNYTVLGNATLRDNSLSLKGSGLLTRMLSLPKNWVFNLNHLASITASGRRAVWSAMQELIKKGYVKKYPERDERGRFIRWVTQVFAVPNPDGESVDSSLQKSRSRQSRSRKKHPIKNTEGNNDLSEKIYIPPLTPPPEDEKIEEQEGGEINSQEQEETAAAREERLAIRQEIAQVCGVELKFNVGDFPQESEQSKVDSISPPICEDFQQKLDFAGVLCKVSVLLAKMKRLGIGKDARQHDQVVATIKECHESQIAATLTHMETTKDEIYSPDRFFVYKAPKMQIERLGAVLPIRTAADFSKVESKPEDLGNLDLLNRMYKGNAFQRKQAIAWAQKFGRVVREDGIFET